MDIRNGVSVQSVRQRRRSERHDITLHGRLLWKDARGAARFTPVITRNVSEHGVFVECETPASIPLYRLVQLQIDRDAKAAELPEAFRQGRVLTAVYRVGRYRTSSGTPEGYALRLLVEPMPVTAATANLRAGAARSIA